MDNLTGNVSFIPDKVREIVGSGDNVVPLDSSLRGAVAWTGPMGDEGLYFDSQGYLDMGHASCIGDPFCSVDSLLIVLTWDCDVDAPPPAVSAAMKEE